MLEIRKDTVRQVERSSLLGEPVMAIPIEVDENEKQTDAAHELHRLSQTPQVVFLLHVFFGQRYLSAENSGIELRICHLQARRGIFSVRKQGCLYSPGLRLLLTETEHDLVHTVEQRRTAQIKDRTCECARQNAAPRHPLTTDTGCAQAGKSQEQHREQFRVER